MRYSTTSGMLLAAVCIGEAVAGPAHVHLHQRAHKNEKKDIVDWSTLDWENMGIDWSSAWAAGQASKTAAAAVEPTTTQAAKVATVSATTTAAAVKAATTTAPLITTIESDIATLWNELVGIANDFTEFGTPTTGSGEDVAAIGNIGYAQGSNMIKVSSREGYEFTNEFINTSGESITVVIWNKAYSTTGSASDAEANLGSCVAPKTPILTFALAHGASQLVAFQENSQIGFCQATSDIAESGAFGTTWGEVNFLSKGSGYDMSAIMNPNGNNYNMTISSAEAACISDMTQNFWLTATDPVGNSDGSCFISQSTATLTTLMGGTV